MGRCVAAVTLFIAAFLPALAQPIVLRDDRGIAVSLPAPAKRIVTLSPHLAEIAFAAGAGAHVVGVAQFSDYPDAVKALPHVGDAARVDAERVLVLKPDLILAWRSGNPASDIDALERLGFRVYVSESARLADVPRLLRAVGVLAGTSAQADVTAQKFERDVAELHDRYGQQQRVRVFYQIWDRPLFTVNRDQIINDVLLLCGGWNIFTDARVLVPAVSLEAVVAARPDVILGGSEADTRAGFIAAWRHAGLASMRRVPVYYVPPDLVQRQSPRVLEAAAIICRDLGEVRRTLQRRK